MPLESHALRRRFGKSGTEAIDCVGTSCLSLQRPEPASGRPVAIPVTVACREIQARAIDPLHTIDLLR
jgi:hypothetical protein